MTISKRKFAKKAPRKSGIKARTATKTRARFSSSAGNQDWDAIINNQRKQDGEEFSEKYNSKEWERTGPYNEDAEIIRDHQMKEDAQRLVDKYYVDPYANDKR